MSELRKPGVFRGSWLGARLVAVLLGIVILSGFPSVVGAAQIVLPVEVQLPLFLKIISFDRNLEERLGEEFVIGVVYQGLYRQSRSVSNAMLGLASESQLELFGKPVSMVPIDIDEEDLITALQQKNVDLAYITPLRALDIPTLSSACSTAGCATVTGVPEYVELGLAIGLELQQEKPSIVVNRQAAAQQNLDLDPRLLHMCRIVKP